MPTTEKFIDLIIDENTWRVPGQESNVDNLWLGYGEQARTSLLAELDEDMIWYAKGQISQEVDDPAMAPIYADAKAELMDRYHMNSDDSEADEKEFEAVAWRTRARLLEGPEWDLQRYNEKFLDIVLPLRKEFDEALIAKEFVEQTVPFRMIVNMLAKGREVKPRMREQQQEKLAARFGLKPYHIARLIDLAVKERAIMDTDGREA